MVRPTAALTRKILSPATLGLWNLLPRRFRWLADPSLSC